ncbi:MAG TPA: MFS transporter [Chloroflexota bacterium]|nr:MFS transporter [Chloroflexota bacterium]
MLLCLAQFMVILDVTVVNVALDTIGDDLALDRGLLTWVLAAYTLTFGGLLLLGGRLADALGRRRTFLVGVAVFTAASLASGLAWHGTALVVSRALQGVGAALLSPAALSLITTTFQGADRHRALGVWAAIGGAGAAAGVLIGGALAGGPGWEWAFFVNVPVGVGVIAGVLAVVAPGPPLPAHRSSARPDVLGAVAVTATAGLLTFGLVNAGGAGWEAPLTLGPLLGGVACGVLFVWLERAVAAPLVPLERFRRRSLVAGNLVMLVAAGLLIASFFLASLYLQRVIGLGAFETGLLFLPVAVAISGGAHAGARLIGRLGARPVAAAGFATATLGFALLAGMPASEPLLLDLLPGVLLPGYLLVGAGLGATFVTATTSAMTDVPHHEAGLVSGLVNTCHELGAALGVGAVSAIAGASVEGVAALGGAGAGFGNAFLASAVAAGAVAALSLRLLPAGRPALTGPVFAH